MIIDTSALVAIHGAEPERERFRDLITAQSSRMSAATAAETFIVLDHRQPRTHQDPETLLEALKLEIVPFDIDQARVARRAYQRFGKGSESRARLNLGDCFAYALSVVSGEPLLFTGEEFTHTDVLPAI